MLKAVDENIHTETAPSCRLVKGKFSPNPGHVIRCNPHCRLDRPQMLIKHHSVEGLELWCCPGCYRNILIKVQRVNKNA